MHRLQRILIGVGTRKLILAEYNWLLWLSLSYVSYCSNLQVFRQSPWNIPGLAQLKVYGFIQ